MGSFYATCSLSQMTLFNQETVIQLMVPSNYDYSGGIRLDGGNNPKIPYQKGLNVYNEVPFGIFSFFGFPIHGRYDDYGYIEDIKMDNNVKKLEEFFNLEIEDILKIAGSDRELDDTLKFDANGVNKSDIENIKVLKDLTMTYFRKDVFDNLCKGYEKLNEYKKPKSKYETNFSTLYNKLKNQYEPKTEMQKIMSFSYDNYLGFIKAQHNFFKLIEYKPIDFLVELKKYYTFVINMIEMNRQILPSHYGTQQINLKPLKDFYKDTLKVINKDISENEDYFYDEFDEAEERKRKLENILKEETLRKKKKKLLKRIKNIDKELEEYDRD